MAITTKTPQQVADEYLINLKSLKPAVNIDQEDSDWWVRSRVVGGVVAGAYSDIRKVSNDAFPQNARREALEQHLLTYFGSGFIDATNGIGNVGVTGTPGSTISVNQVLTHPSTGKTYTVTSSVTLTGASGVVPIKSVLTGQDQNLLLGTSLSFSPAPAGVNANSIVLTPGVTDARDVESNDEAAARVLDRIRSRIRGGTESDYKQWAIEADPSVVSSTVLRFPFGLGTVQVVITAGTTDIDAAVDSGSAVTLVPSPTLINTVYQYIDSVNPLTDCLSVSGPNPITIDATVYVKFSSGDTSTIIADLGITQGEAVRRELQRAIYKTPIGGRKFGTLGYVVASEMEEMIDFNLSATTITTGAKRQIVVDRQVSNLTVSGANRLILRNEVATPGTLNVLDF